MNIYLTALKAMQMLKLKHFGNAFYHLEIPKRSNVFSTKNNVEKEKIPAVFWVVS
jgi:hypothetical protein